MPSIRKRTVGLERELSEAIKRAEFWLLYQPQLSLSSNRLAGVEALLRWEHPERGLLAPDQFIPVAESSGLIVPMGAWVIREACLRVERWRREFPHRPPLMMSVNVASKQLADPELPRVIASAIARHRLAPGDLCVEITEGSLREDRDFIDTLVAIRRLGVRLAIDDFGSRDLSLDRLRRLPRIDFLKIDKSFVDGLVSKYQDAAAVRALVALAHSLNSKAVAEGVESAEQVAQLRTLGCDIIQGYYYGLPMLADDVGVLILTDKLRATRRTA